MASDINWSNVLITVVVIILLYYLISWLFSSSSKQTTEESASEQQDINNKDLPESNAGANSTYAIWIYIDNWEGADSSKTIMKRGNFTVELTPNVNDLQITTPLAGGQDNVCVVPNIPIQKWVCIIISNFGRSQDIYLDGKLVKTCIMDNVSNIASSANITITPNGGFSGATSAFRYIPDATNPEEAWNIYREGAGQSIFGSLLGNYGFKMEILKNNERLTGFEI